MHGIEHSTTSTIMLYKPPGWRAWCWSAQLLRCARVQMNRRTPLSLSADFLSASLRAHETPTTGSLHLRQTVERLPGTPGKACTADE